MCVCICAQTLRGEKQGSSEYDLATLFQDFPSFTFFCWLTVCKKWKQSNTGQQEGSGNEAKSGHEPLKMCLCMC